MTMMMTKKSYIFLIFLFFIFQDHLLFSQQNDFEIWTAFSVRKDINKKLQIELEEGIRFNQNIQSYKKSFTDLGIKYEINNFLDLSGNYRFEQRNLYGNRFSFKHRFNLDVILNKDIRRFETSFRSRYQIKFSDIANSENVSIPDQYMRSRFKLEYDIVKSSIQPEISAEFYNGLNRENILIHQRSRYTLGISFEPYNDLKIGVYYRIQQEINTVNPLNSYILGFNARYNLK